MSEILNELTGILSEDSDKYFVLDLVNLGDVCYDAVSYELEQIADHYTDI